MPHSLKSKVKSLCYKGELSEKERDRIIHALEQQCEEENLNCTECRYYDHEKHHCPRFCKVIEDTMAEITSDQERWIPITKRPMEDDEKPWHESCYDEAEILDCPLPEDGEDVLITAYGRTWIDTFLRDETDGCYFESYDIDEVKAWQRFPKPYKAESENKE